MDKWSKRLIKIALILLIIYIFSKIKYIFQPILDILGMLLGPIIISLFFYYILRPVVRKLTNKAGKKYQSLISIVIVIFSLFIITLIISRAGVVLVNQFRDAFFNEGRNFVGYKDMIQDSLKGLNIDEEFIKRISKSLDNTINNIGKKTIGLFSGIGDKITQVVLIPFILFYLLKDDRKDKSKILSIIPLDKKQEVVEIFEEIDLRLSIYILGQLLVALIIGGLMFIGYLVLKVPNTLLMAVFSTITAIIPIIGAFLGILPALLIAITIDLKLVIKIIILSIIVQQLEGNLITPNLMGSKLSVHPLIIMIVIIASINLMGIFGAFIGMPVYIILSILFKKLYFDKIDE